MAIKAEKQPQPTIPDIHKRTLLSFAELIQQTSDALCALRINLDDITHVSPEAAYQLLRLINERFNFIANDMQREAEGKHPLDGIRLEYWDLSEDFKAKHANYSRTEGC